MLFANTELNFQVRELERFTQFSPEKLAHLLKTGDSLTNPEDEHPLFFIRAGLLYGIETILNSNLKDDREFDMKHKYVWDGILDFILACNTKVTESYYQPKSDIATFEELNAGMLSLNELTITPDPILTSYRGLKLTEYLLGNRLFKDEIKDYFDKIIKIEPTKFIFDILSIYWANNNGKDRDLEFFYKVEGDTTLFDFLSDYKMSNPNPERLLTIKKSPFYHDKDNQYIILDNAFLVEKAYNFLLNDFWFDYLKLQKSENEKDKYNIKEYRSEFGYFFEEYIRGSIEYAFESFKYPKPFLFDDLKITKRGVGDIETADVYIRQNKKIILGQVKSSSIYDNEKYSGKLADLYKSNRDKFFKTFGLMQLVKSIEKLKENINLFDKSCPTTKRLTIYPILILNDTAFMTPLMTEVFNKRFQDALLSITVENLNIKGLVLIHVSDMERMEESLHNRELSIWNIFNEHYKNKPITPPFHHTINRLINKVKYSKRITDDVFKLTKEFENKPK